jgi:HEAT repeat protein
MSMDRSAQIVELLEMLNSKNRDDRVAAIEVLGEIGDEAALSALRTRLPLLHDEYYALVVAVGKLKKRLRVK